MFRRRGPVETGFCEAPTTNDPGWLTYLPNCISDQEKENENETN